MPPTTETAPADAGKYSRRVASAKETFVMARELIVVLLIIAVASWPEGLRRWMNRGDFDKLGVGTVEVSAREAQKSVQAVGDVQQRLQDSTQKLTEVGQKLSDPQKLGINVSTQDAQKLKELAGELSTPLQVSQSAQQELAVARQSAEEVIQRAAPSLPSVSGTWGIVVSGDKNNGRPQDFDPAEFEVSVAAGLGKQVAGAATALYDRQGWFRTVIEFGSNKDALAALPDVRKWRDKAQGQRYASAYVVNIDEWCPGRRQQQADPFPIYQCPNP